MEEKSQKVKRLTLGNDIVAALDIGTSKICCAIGKKEPDKGIRILGIGYQLSKGFRSGMITNMEALENAILNAVSHAEQMAGITISEIYLNLSGKHITSELIEVDYALSPEGVTDEVLKAIYDLGWTGYQIPNKDIIYAQPISYEVDDQRNISDPKGMFGSRLKARIHIISGLSNVLRNLVVCVNRCQLDITGVSFSGHASGDAVLISDEKELGALVVDLGGGGTSISYFEGDRLVWADSVSIGSHHITNDIAHVLLTPVAQAERLKTLYGSAIVSKSDEKEAITVPQVSENDIASIQIPRSVLVNIIQPRLEEIFEGIREKVISSGFSKALHQRIILTGGGSQLPSIRDLCMQKLGKNVRLGRPIDILGLSETSNGPAFATCAGLLKQGLTLTEKTPNYLFSDSASLWGKLKNMFRKNT